MATSKITAGLSSSMYIDAKKIAEHYNMPMTEVSKGNTLKSATFDFEGLYSPSSDEFEYYYRRKNRYYFRAIDKSGRKFSVESDEIAKLNMKRGAKGTINYHQ